MHSTSVDLPAPLSPTSADDLARAATSKSTSSAPAWSRTSSRDPGSEGEERCSTAGRFLEHNQWRAPNGASTHRVGLVPYLEYFLDSRVQTSPASGRRPREAL